MSNNTRAREELGWEPQVSLVDGLRRTVEWIAANPERFSPHVYAI